MAQDLQVTAAPLLPVLDLDRPTFLESHPSWLASRITADHRSENRRAVLDEWGRKVGEVRTLPPSLMLTGAMRAVLSRRIAELEAALQPGPPETILESIGLLLSRYFRRLEPDDLAAQADTYVVALDGLPGWTVGAAVRRWFKGKCGGSIRDYDFAPSEARLCQVAEGIANATCGQILVFRRLLLAEPEPEISEAVRERQAAELAALAVSLGTASRARTARPPPQPQRPALPDLPVRDRAEVAAELEERRARREAQDAVPSDTPELPLVRPPVDAET